ncbi:anti-sigma factor family protein [Streptomyces scopuliridis]|uniref:Membrane protein n=1 Tax=Streptomyces scopuliridis RB72 TaxID=1440053 RepID=A0A2T7T1X4_9ACTN|nr:zf-HC2 domain-containing protein [Streptomyces scopuliridis]PVE09134.1 membrane protein [Streptomyces scopuliridis RB72]
MTSTTDMAQHPDVSEISDLAEGLLSPSRTADVRRHLDGCALCADVHDSLEEIRGLLGTLPGPPRMPADVAGRIDAALAAEALLNATAPEEAADVSRETSPSSETSSPRRPSAPAIAAPTGPPSPAESTAETVRTDRPAGRPRAATGPGRSGHTRRRRRNAVLGAVFGTAAVGVSVLLLQSLGISDDNTASKQADAAASAPRNGSKEFSEAHLQSRVDALLASGASVKESKGSTAEEPRDTGSDRNTANTPLLQPEPEVPPCVQQGTGSTAPALAAEPGTYQGSSAYLVVLPHATDSTRVQAYVIDAACVDSDPSGTGKVLLKHAYLRR